MLKLKIRVLYTIPNFDTAGSGKALLNIAKGLNKDKFEVIIMCKHKRGALFQSVENSGIPTHIYDYETPMRPIIRGLSECWKVSRELKKIKPDIIHSFHYSADYSEALAARMASCKWVFTKKNMNWGRGSKNAWHLRSFLASGIIAQNTDMIERFYPKSQKTTLIPRGVNTEFFTAKHNNKAKPLNKRTIICVANLVPVKGIEILVEAFEQILTDNPNDLWQLKIVGDDNNEYGEHLKARYKYLIAKQKLIFTGKVLDVKRELNSSEIFVLPTLNEGRMEGSPVSLLEAMSMGLVVLGSRIPGIKDQLKSFDENYLFEPGNVEDLTKKLQTFMEMTKEELIDNGKKISDYCRSNWDISKEVKRHEQFYLKIINT